jgi:uncharacterized membrane protein
VDEEPLARRACALLLCRMTLGSVVATLRVALEATAVLIVAIGAAVTLWKLAAAAVARRHISFNAVRLDMARYLALALEFLLAADIVLTTVDPDWSSLGELAVIAAIRTALNYFLAREMREEREVAARTAS